LSDEEVLRRAHRFVRNEKEDGGGGEKEEKKKEKRHRRENEHQKAKDPTSASWVAPAVRAYESRLFKEYAIVDLSRASEAILVAAAAAKARAEQKKPEKGGGDDDGAKDDETAAPPPPPIGLRWRIEREVLSGKGETTCAERSCPERTSRLETLELPFAYREAGEAKAALVKCRLCPEHARVARWAARKRGREEEEEAGTGDSSSSESESSDEEEKKRKRKKEKKKEKKKKKKKKKH